MERRAFNTDPLRSAQPCGCDAGAGWVCEQHTGYVGGMMDYGELTLNPKAGLPGEAVAVHAVPYDIFQPPLLPGSSGGTSSFTIKDSGERRQFDSGSLRDTTAGKIDYSRAFDGPLIERLAEHLTKGEAKYPDYAPGKPNWTLISTEEERVRYRKSAVRHFIQWYRGDTDEDHFAASVFNMNGAELIKDKMRRANES